MTRRLLSGGIGILVAFIVGGIIMVVQGYDPFSTYGALFEFSLIGSGPVATTLKNSVPLVLTGLSASVAFASGPINLGQPGQLLFGALAATLAGIYVPIPAALQIPFLILAAVAGGAIWSGVAAFLRQAFGMSEFIVTLMLNMIADFFTAWAIAYPFMDRKAYSSMTLPIAQAGWLPDIGPASVSVIIMALAVVVIWFVFQRWTAGYEWRMTGKNPVFARLGGCEINRNFWAIMLVTGALAGLAGGLVVMGGPHRFIKGLGANYAWDGIMIAIMANNSVVGTLIYGVLIAAIQTGALGMELITNVPSEIAEVLQAVLVLVIVAMREYLNVVFDRVTARRRARERSA